MTNIRAQEIESMYHYILLRDWLTGEISEYLGQFPGDYEEASEAALRRYPSGQFVLRRVERSR